MICRAITVRQPWTWSMVHATTGPKLVENRGRGAAFWRYRGLVLIHSSLRWSDRGAADPRVLETLPDDARRAPGELALEPRPHACSTWPGFAFGAIIGGADLVDIHPEHGGCCQPWGEDEYQAADGATEKQVTHLLFEDVRPLAAPVAARGALGLWSPPPDVIEAVAAQLPF